MDTISELEAKLAELQKQLEELKQQPQAVKEIPLEEFLPFAPKRGDKYFIISALVRQYEWENDVFDIAALEQGNVFRTERVARIIMENRATLAKLKRLANFVPDWSDFKQQKWLIKMDFSNGFALSFGYIRAAACSDVYFRTKDETIAAAEKVGHARIKQLRQYGV